MFAKKRREKTLNIAKLTDWALRLDHPPWTASKRRGKQRFRRILTPLDSADQIIVLQII